MPQRLLSQGEDSTEIYSHYIVVRVAFAYGPWSHKPFGIIASSFPLPHCRLRTCSGAEK
jgi:hypothetical protein